MAPRTARFVALLLVLPCVFAGPLVFSGPFLAQALGSIGASPVGPIWLVLFTTLAMSLQGLAWIGAVFAPRGFVRLLLLVGSALAVVWMVYGGYAAATSLQVIRKTGVDGMVPFVVGNALMFAGVPAMLAGMVATTTVRRLRPTTLLAVCSMLAIAEGTRVRMQVFQMFWGVPWVWDAQAVFLAAFHGSVVLAGIGAALACWADPPVDAPEAPDPE